jgi:hypothetical protein
MADTKETIGTSIGTCFLLALAIMLTAWLYPDNGMPQWVEDVSWVFIIMVLVATTLILIVISVIMVKKER